MHVVNRGGFLQVNRYNSLTFLLLALFEMPIIPQLLPADLAPAARRTAEIDNSIDSLEDVEDIIDLQQFICRPGAIALLLGFAIVDILNQNGSHDVHGQNIDYSLLPFCPQQTCPSTIQLQPFFLIYKHSSTDIYELILSFLIQNIRMRNTLKSSTFKKEHSVKITFPEEKEAEEEAANLERYINRSEDSKANRWLNHLHERPLLQLMNEQLQKNQFTPLKPTELNCYERLKTLLAVQNKGKCTTEQAESNSKLLRNVVTFETEINKLQQNYKDLERGKKSAMQSKSSGFYICSKSGSKPNGFFDKNAFSTTLNTTLKQYAKTSNNSRYSTKHDNPKNQQIKKTIKQQIKELKKQSFSKFIQKKKEINDQTYVDLDQLINSELDKKIEQMVNRKIVEYQQVKQENSKFNKILLQKQLHIEHLLKQLKIKEERLVYQMGKQEPHQEMITLRLTVQQFYDEYQTIFGSVSLVQLKKKFLYMENMCLNKFSSNEGQHLQIYSRMKHQKMELQEKLKASQKRYCERQQNINAILSRKEKYEQLDNSQETHEIFKRLPEYKLKINELQKLQKYILNRYVEWLDNKNGQEGKVIKTLNSQYSNLNYQEMISDMIYFSTELSSPEKQTSYMGKLLTAILKLKKLTAPNKLHQKFQPLKSLQQVQIYIKNIKSNKRTINKKKTLKPKTDMVIEAFDEAAFME